MTALVVLDGNQRLNETLTVTMDDVDRLKGTGSRLAVGSRLSRADMLHIALMSSENRAASALGRHYPGGRKAFIEAMNAKARMLGTHFARQPQSQPRSLAAADHKCHNYSSSVGQQPNRELGLSDRIAGS